MGDDLSDNKPAICDSYNYNDEMKSGFIQLKNVSERTPVNHILHRMAEDKNNINNSQNLRYELLLTDDNNNKSKNNKNYLVSMHLPFGINEHTGSIYVTRPLDYELHTSHTFFVRVFSSTSSKSNNNPLSQCLFKVRVELSDVNDNAPVFQGQDQQDDNNRK